MNKLFLLFICLLVKVNFLYCQHNSCQKWFDKFGDNYFINQCNDSLAVFNNEITFVLNFNGDTIIPAQYGHIYQSDLGHFVVANVYNKGAILDLRGKAICPFEYYNIVRFDDGYKAKRKNELVFLNAMGQEVSHPVLSKYNVGQEYKGLYVAGLNQRKNGVLDKKLKWVVEPKYRSVQITDHLIMAQLEEGFDLYNFKGEKLNRELFITVIPMGTNFWAKEKDLGLFHLYDINGHFQKNAGAYYEVFTDRKNVKGKLGDKQFYIDSTGKVILEGMDITRLNNLNSNNKISDYYQEGEHNSKGLYMKGTLLTEKKYLYFTLMGDTIVYNAKFGVGFLNSKGQILQAFKPNVALLYKDKIYHSYNGEIKIDSLFHWNKNKFIPIAKCNNVEHLYKGAFKTHYSGKENLYHEDGKLVLQNCSRISYRSYFKNVNCFEFQRGGYTGALINNVLMDDKYTDIKHLGPDLLLVKKNLEWFFMDIEGIPINAEIYDDVKIFDNGSKCIGLYQNKKWVIFNTASRANFKNIFFDELIYKQNLIYGRDGKNWSVYTSDFKELASAQDYIPIATNGLLKIKGNYHFYNYRTKALINLESDTAWIQNYKYVLVKKDKAIQFCNYYYSDLQNNEDWIYISNADSVEILEDKYLQYFGGKASLYTYDHELILEKFDTIKFLSYGPYPYIVLKNKKAFLCNDKNDLKEVFEADRFVFIQSGKFIKYTFNNKISFYDLIAGKIIQSNFDDIINYHHGVYFVSNNFLYGTYDKNFKEILPCHFSNVQPFLDTFIQVRQNGLYGIYNIHGHICVPLDSYESSSFTHTKKLIFARKNGYTGVYSITDKKWIPPSKYEDIKSCNIRLPLNGELFLFREGGKYGVMNEKCDVLVSSVYDEITSNGNYLILGNDKLKQFYDPFKKVMSNKSYNNLRIYDNTIIAETRSQNLYDIYVNGRIMKSIEAELIDFAGSSMDLNVRNLNGYYNYYNLEKDKYIFTIDKYDHVKRFSDDRFVAKVELNYGLIDNKEQQIFPFIASYIEFVSPNLYRVTVNKKYGLINNDGTYILQPVYDVLDLDYSPGRETYSFIRDSFIDVFNLSFDKLFTANRDFIGNFRYGLAPVKSNKKWGYINIKGELVIPLIYDYAHDFSSFEEKAFVVYNRKYMFIDRLQKEFDFINLFAMNCNSTDAYNRAQGKLDRNKCYPAKTSFSLAEDYSSYGYFIVKDKNTQKYGISNIFDELVVPCKYESIARTYDEPYFFIKDKDKYGLMDLYFNEVIKPIYDHMEANDDSKILATLNGSKFLIDYKGNRIDR